MEVQNWRRTGRKALLVTTTALKYFSKGYEVSFFFLIFRGGNGEWGRRNEEQTGARASAGISHTPETIGFGQSGPSIGGSGPSVVR